LLSLLHIENIAVIESADISFTDGLNVLTGETGAGKSIVIDAIGALLGARVGRDLVRYDTPRARVTGLFTGLSDDVIRALGELDVVCEDGELLLCREITADGRTSARVGGRPVTAAVLRSIAPYLLHILGQHDTGRLLNESTHLPFVDRAGDCGALLNTYREKYAALRAIEREMETLKIDDAEKARRADNLRYHIGKLEAAKLKAGEDTRLEKRRSQLRGAAQRQEAATQTSVCLSGSDDAMGAVSLMRQAAQILERGAGDDADTQKLAERLTELSYEVEDVAEHVADMSFAYDPRELDAIEGRLYTLDRLRKRYGATVDDMLSYLETARKELETLDTAEARLDELGLMRQTAYKEALDAADALHQRRVETAASLSKAVEEELAYLDMPRARFDVSLTIPREADGAPTLMSDGIDRAAFLIAVNAGEELKALAKVASGGELSRVMLALQTVLTSGQADDADIRPTLIFDEIDAGLSGRAAGKVARKLRSLADGRQVLCVTHLGQFAAAAHSQFCIRKTERGGRTYTEVLPLDDDARETELARLLAGENKSETVRGAARELLREYQNL
jgi:DNA repair protein RecN (Recombination protein N)